MATAWTIGHEKLLPGALVAELRAAGVHGRVVTEALQARRADLRVVDL